VLREILIRRQSGAEPGKPEPGIGAVSYLKGIVKDAGAGRRERGSPRTCEVRGLDI